jgi:hypothetical protein
LPIEKNTWWNDYFTVIRLTLPQKIGIEISIKKCFRFLFSIFVPVRNDTQQDLIIRILREHLVRNF